MIKMLRAKDGRLTPVFLCDVCGERIRDTSLAAALHPPYSTEGELLDVLYVHKGECHRFADEQLAGPDGRAPWFDMGRQICLLLHNAGLDSEKLKEILRLYGPTDSSLGDYHLGRSPSPQDGPF